MSRQQQRFVVRLSFLLFAVIPTALVVAWLVVGSPKRAWEREINSHFPWDMKAGTISEANFNSVVCTDVRFTDPVQGDCASLNELEVHLSDEKLTVLGDHLQVSPQSLGPLLDDLIHYEVRRGRVTIHEVHVRLQKVTVRAETKTETVSSDANALSSAPVDIERSTQTSLAQTWEQFELDLEMNKTGFEAALSFLPAGNLESHRVNVHLLFENATESHPSRWQIAGRTENTSIPCRLISSWLPGLDKLGPALTFQGQFRAQIDETGSWDLQLAGFFENLDLYSATRNFSDVHSAQGTAKLELTDLEFRQGRIIHVNGLLTSEGGQLSRSLLSRGGEQLGWYTVQEQSSNAVSFHSLQLSFDLGTDEFLIEGLNGDGVIALSLENQPLAQTWASNARSPLDLVRFLSGDSYQDVPLSANTIGLANVLPIPATRPLSGSDSGTNRIGLESE